MTIFVSLLGVSQTQHFKKYKLRYKYWNYLQIHKLRIMNYFGVIVAAKIVHKKRKLQFSRESFDSKNPKRKIFV